MKMLELDNLLSKIANDDTLMYDSKICYMKMIRASENLNNRVARDYEDRAYRVTGGVLSDKERIMYELNSLVRETNSRDVTYRISLNDLESLSRKAINCLPGDKEELLNIKRDVCIMQCDLGITPKFYTAFEKVLDAKSMEYSGLGKERAKVNRNSAF